MLSVFKTKREQCLHAMTALVRQMEEALEEVVKGPLDPADEECAEIVRHFQQHVVAWRPPDENIPTLE